MPAFTEAQLKRIREIGIASRTGTVPNIGFKTADVALLVSRLEALSDVEHLLGADPLMRWTADRLEEELRSAKEWLSDAIEQVRIAELQVKEAEHALAGVKALLEEDGMFKSGGEIIERWDAMEALYASQGMLPVPAPAQIEAPEEAPPEPEAIDHFSDLHAKAVEPEDFSDLPPALVDQLSEDHPAKAAEPPAPVAQPRPPPAPPRLPGEQEDRLYEALQRLAAGEPMIQARLSVLAEESGVPKGSCHAVLHRLQDAGRITIIKPPPKNNVPQPNIYRFGAVAAEEAPEPPAESPKVEEPEPPTLPPIVAAEKLAEAWGATVKKKPAAPVPQSAPLRDRILGVLSRSASTTSGLASMLDVKELAICQTLEAMKHEGSVQTDEMPEAGRRAQLWRQAVTETSPA